MIAVGDGRPSSWVAAVDTLGNQDRTPLAKSAGRKLLGIAAADVAGITAATTAYGAWEKQMEALNTQAAVLNKNMAMQKSSVRLVRPVGEQPAHLVR